MLEMNSQPARVERVHFSPDGRQLIAANGTQGICVWDLHTIRSRLAEMDLDWDLPVAP